MSCPMRTSLRAGRPNATPQQELSCLFALSPIRGSRENSQAPYLPPVVSLLTQMTAAMSLYDPLIGCILCYTHCQDQHPAQFLVRWSGSRCTCSSVINATLNYHSASVSFLFKSFGMKPSNPSIRSS